MAKTSDEAHEAIVELRRELAAKDAEIARIYRLTKGLRASKDARIAELEQQVAIEQNNVTEMTWRLKDERARVAELKHQRDDALNRAIAIGERADELEAALRALYEATSAVFAGVATDEEVERDALYGAETALRLE